MNLKSLFIEMNLEPFSYSGKGMHGKQCLAVSTSTIGHFLADFLSEFTLFAEDVEPDEFEAFRTIEVDHLGKDDIVVYFPTVKWEESEEDDDNEDDLDSLDDIDEGEWDEDE